MYYDRLPFIINAQRLGFNYHFDSLNADDKPNELNQAFSTIFGARKKLELLPILQAYFPVARAIVRATFSDASFSRHNPLVLSSQ
jgi:hypothetical protein